MNVPDQVDERKDKIPMQTSQQSWLSISQKNEESNILSPWARKLLSHPGLKNLIDSKGFGGDVMLS